MIRTHDAPASPAPGIVRAGELIDVMIEPEPLFLRPYDAKRWKLFLAATSVCVLIGSALTAFVRMHVEAPGQAERNAAFTLIATPFSMLVLMGVGIGLSFAVAILLQKPLKTGTPVKETWTLVNEIALVKLGLSTLALGVIVTIRGAGAFPSPQDIVRAMPSLAMFFSQAPDRVTALLGIVDPFNVWVCVLYAIAFRAVFRARTPFAVCAGFAIGLLPQIIVRFLVP